MSTHDKHNDPSLLRRRPEQERAQRSFDAILAAAAELIGEQGSEAFSMAELARRAGVSKAALYRYFPNKRAILLELARVSFEENRKLLPTQISIHPGEEWPSLRAALTDYCELQNSQPYRRHLRAAMNADPELAALDLADSRRNACETAAFLAERYPSLDRDKTESSLLLIMGLVDGLANLASQVEAEERSSLIDAFLEMSASLIPTPVPTQAPLS